MKSELRQIDIKQKDKYEFAFTVPMGQNVWQIKLYRLPAKSQEGMGKIIQPVVQLAFQFPCYHIY